MDRVSIGYVGGDGLGGFWGWQSVFVVRHSAAVAILRSNGVAAEENSQISWHMRCNMTKGAIISFFDGVSNLARLARAVQEWAVVDDDVAVLGWGADYGGHSIDEVWDARKREMVSLARQFL